MNSLSVSRKVREGIVEAGRIAFTVVGHVGPRGDSGSSKVSRTVTPKWTLKRKLGSILSRLVSLDVVMLEVENVIVFL